MQLNTDFKLAGPLAGLFGGITEAQTQEGKGLQNAYQMLKNQEQQYTSAEAQAKLQDPRYIQMKLENDMSKMGKEIPLNQLEAEYNVANRALAHLKVAAASSPQELEKVSNMYMTQLKIDPNSQEGQMIRQDPVGFAEKTVQMIAASATKNPEYMRQYGLENVKGEWGMKKQESANEAHLAGQRISSGATLQGLKYSADKQAQIQATQLQKDASTQIAKTDELIAKASPNTLTAVMEAQIRASVPGAADIPKDQLVNYLKEVRKEYVKQHNHWASITGAPQLKDISTPSSAASTSGTTAGGNSYTVQEKP